MSITIEPERDFSAFELGGSGGKRGGDRFSLDYDGGSDGSRGERSTGLQTTGADLFLNEGVAAPRKAPAFDDDIDKRSDRSGFADFRVEMQESPGSPVAPAAPAFDEPSYDAPRYASAERDYDARSEASYGHAAGATDPSYAPRQPAMSPEQVEREKRAILQQLHRLENRGVFVGKRWDMDSPLEDMKAEYEHIKAMHDSETAVKFWRNATKYAVTGIELFNKSPWAPVRLQLDGWAEGVHESVEQDQYDDVLEELHAKYSGRVKVWPEAKFLGMLAGSAVMTHFSNSMLNSSSDPDMAELVREDPELLRQVQAAAMKKKAQQTPGLSSLFGMMNMMGAGIPAGPAQTPARAAPAPPAAPVQRKEMRPPNMDDLLSGIDLSPMQAPVPQAPRGRAGPAPVEEDIRSVNLSELNEFDRISEISSLDASEVRAGDMVGRGLGRPAVGMRATHRDALIKKIRSKKASKGPEPGGLVIEV